MGIPGVNFTAFFLNSSQDSGERGKAKSKQSGPHNESIAEGAMDEEEDRSGKAAAGQIPDEFRKEAVFTPACLFCQKRKRKNRACR